MVNKYNPLVHIQNHFRLVHNATIIIGAELEFYLSPEINPNKLSEIIGYEIKDEKGHNQFEISFAPSSDVAQIAQEIENTRDNIINVSKTLGGDANFNSKPFKDDYGSSMQIHLNILELDKIEEYARILCKTVYRYIHACLPSIKDYQRLDSRFMAPTHISWGGNNRSVMIRIPDSLPKRLEHRLPGANVDAAIVIHSILESLNYGIFHELGKCNFSKTYGNAFDEQYSLQKIDYKNYKL